MAASTITRATITDGVGGTTFNSAWVNSAIYDNVDGLLSGNLNIGGVFTSEGQGTNTFSAGPSGSQIVIVQNTAAGTANLGAVHVGNDSDADLGRFEAYSSSFTEAGAANQNGVAVRGLGAGGLVIAAEHASGEIEFMAGGTTLVAGVDSNYIYGSGAVPMYAVTLADADNTTSEITVFTATVARAVADGDMLISNLNLTYLNNTGGNQSLQIDVLYGTVEATLQTFSIQTSATENFRCLQFVWIRNGADMSVGSVAGLFQDGASVQLSSPTTGVTLTAPTFTASQTLSIKVTLGSASASLYFRPEGGALRHHAV